MFEVKSQGIIRNKLNDLNKLKGKKKVSVKRYTIILYRFSTASLKKTS